MNGSPFGFFNSSRSLTQGDLLSPVLFALGMEAFSIMLSIVVNNGFLTDFLVGDPSRCTKLYTYKRDCNYQKEARSLL